MGSLHPASFKALSHLLWLWRDLKVAKRWCAVWSCKPTWWLVTSPFKVRDQNLHIMGKKDGGIVMPNFTALCAAVFSLSTKNSGGGGGYPLSVGARLRGKHLFIDNFEHSSSSEYQVKIFNFLFYFNVQFLSLTYKVKIFSWYSDEELC